ncbi:hypothetical protein [Streptomyces sp. KR80]|uniref:hypothetical protein n=1 Tax=Streptomyces sp. KR80 TaxID=3457426 RepID=UPI003FCFD4C5
MQARTALVTAVALAAALTACGDDNGRPPPATETVTSPEETPRQTEPETSPEAEETGEQTLSLTETATFQDNIQVSLSSFTRAVSSGTASPANTPYARFTIKITNGADRTIDLNVLTLQCLYGDPGMKGDQISDEGLEGIPTTHLLPDRSITAQLGCELPRNETYLQIEIAPGLADPAIFAGTVK